MADQVKVQYDEQHTITFYQYVMGGGGHDIHFGVYRDPSWGVKESANATTELMMTLMDWAKPCTKDSYVLDLGSGHGGGTHAMVQKFGCKAMDFNLGPEQNAFNMEQCKTLGIADSVETRVGDLNDPFPEDFTGKFDFCWSCEVFCHAADKVAVLKEIKRCLKPGGIFVMSDIMGADGADEKALKDFTDRNATTKMARPSEYIAAMKEAGLTYVTFWDNSNNMEKYFADMLSQTIKFNDEMVAKGVPQAYLDNWRQSLTDRVAIQKEHGVFAHGVFVVRN